VRNFDGLVWARAVREWRRLEEVMGRMLKGILSGGEERRLWDVEKSSWNFREKLKEVEEFMRRMTIYLRILEDSFEICGDFIKIFIYFYISSGYSLEIFQVNWNFLWKLLKNWTKIFRKILEIHMKLLKSAEIDEKLIFCTNKNCGNLKKIIKNSKENQKTLQAIPQEF
jgi:hypothetical protein